MFLFRAVLFFVGGDFGDVDGDVDADFGGDFDGSDTDLSFKFLSLQGLTAFFMMFGLSGLAFTSSGVAAPLTVLGGAVVGVFSVWVLSLIFNFFVRLQSDGTLKVENAIGQTGTVYLRIPAGGTGQVRVAVQGGLKIFDAKAADGAEISTGTAVKVLQVQGGRTLVVETVSL